MKKALAFILALLVLATINLATANASPPEVSIENLVKNSASFNGGYVTLQGFPVVQQVFTKPTAYYLRDSANNMIELKLSKSVDLSNYKKIQVTGAFKVENKEIHIIVDRITPLEESSPESQLVTGAQNTMVVMAYFTNRLNTIDQGGVYRMVFNDMNGYYMEASYDQMWVTGGWYPWINVGNTVAYYGQDIGTTIDPYSWRFIRDAVAKVDPYVNFAGYTRLLFVNAGPNQETSHVTTDIWSARWSGLSIPTNDGVTITHGAIIPDKEAGVAGALGVTAHEYGHELGLPDLYGYAGGVGSWDGMAEGVWNNNGNTPASFTSYIRNLQGWIASSKIRTIPFLNAELVTLDPLEDPTGTIQMLTMYEIEAGYYWIIEARRKVGFDAALPGEKVLVLYHDGGNNRLYLKATLGVGQSFRTPSVEVMVVKQDIDNWSFQVYVAFKTWSSDKRLTINGAASEMNWRGGAVASVGSYVYVVWDDTRDGNWEIYFKRSTDSGLTWGPDTRLTSQVASSWYPSVAAYGSYVYVVWQDFRDGNWEIYLLRNERYGDVGMWYSAQRLTVNAAVSNFPSVAAFYRNVHVVWHDNRDGHYEIRYERSLNNGLTWGPDTRLSILDAFDSDMARVGVHMTNVYVAWEDRRNGNWDIYFKRSLTNGDTWGSDTRLTTNALDQRYPSVAAYYADVHVAWTDYRNTGNTEIYWRRSTNYGSSFLGETRLTNNAGSTEQPSLAARGRTVYLVWADTRTGSWEVWFKDSPDRGAHWTADRILSAQPNNSAWPSVSIAGDNVYVAWTDTRDGNNEVYFKYRW